MFIYFLSPAGLTWKEIRLEPTEEYTFLIKTKMQGVSGNIFTLKSKGGRIKLIDKLWLTGAALISWHDDGIGLDS